MDKAPLEFDQQLANEMLHEESVAMSRMYANREIGKGRKGRFGFRMTVTLEKPVIDEIKSLGFKNFPMSVIIRKALQLMLKELRAINDRRNSTEPTLGDGERTPSGRKSRPSP